MKFELTDEQKMLQNMCRDFAEQVIKPVASKLDREHVFPADIVKQMGELGLMGILAPTDLSGAGMDCVSYAIAMEEISRACASCSVIMTVNNSLYIEPILHHGNKQQHEKFIRPVASGKVMGCFGLTEPMSGSDAAEMKTIVRKTQNGFLLNGTKNFITNGSEAKYAVIFAMTEPEKRHKGITAFIVDADSKGFIRGRKEEKLGLNASSTCTLTFENIELFEENLLGEYNNGFKVAMQTLDCGRIGIAGQAVGIAQAAYEAALAYAQERHSFGKMIAEHQTIQFKLAEMATNIEAARLLTLKAAVLKDQGKRHTKESAMAKLFASDVAVNTTREAIQIFGGYGYMKEYPVERFYRDAKITEIYEGTSEIQRIVIASQAIKEFGQFA